MAHRRLSLVRPSIIGLVTFLSTVRLAAGTVTDEFVADPATHYINIEFSPDGQYATFLEGNPTPWGNIEYTGWLAQIDQATGDLIPTSGKGHALGSSKLVGMMQFGVDSLGNYAVMLNEEGRIVRIRPNGDNAPTIEVIADDTVPEELEKRAFPFPSRNAGSSLQYVTYQVRDQAANIFKQYLVELTEDPANHALVYSEPYAIDREPAAIVSFARWMPGSFLFTHGALEEGCVSPCPTQLKAVLPQTGASWYVTEDNRSKIDTFPFQSSVGGLGLVSGINGTAQGGLFNYDPATELFVYDREITFDDAQSDLEIPGIAQSFEPFRWGGEDYVVYQVVDAAWDPVFTNIARAFPGEIWVARLSPPYSTCRVSAIDYPDDPMSPLKRARIDAEPLLYDGGNRVALYYHSTLPEDTATLLGDLRRIDLGTKTDFDSQCQTGTAYPAGDYDAPTVPGGLAATPISVSKTNLSWNRSTDNVRVAGYKIYRDGALAGIATTPSYRDTGLTASTTYAYTVAAYDAQGITSAESTAVSATTLEDTAPPSVPVGLTATALSASQISLSWSPSTDNVGVIYYKILRCYNVNCTPTTPAGSPTSTSFTSSGLGDGVTYRYTVSAVDAKGNTSAPSAVASATTFDTSAPKIQHIYNPAVTSSSATITWITNEPSDSWVEFGAAASYGSTTGHAQPLVTSHSVSLNGLSSGITYHYRVKSNDAAGNNVVSADRTFTTTERQISPSVTDPNITGPVPGYGDYEHTVFAPVGQPIGKLFVFFPGTNGPPVGYKYVVDTAASIGHHAIGLVYPNDESVNHDICIPSNVPMSELEACKEEVRLETITGQDVTPYVDVNRANSIENRLIKLLEYLKQQYPLEGWGAYLDAGQPRWGRIIVSGHSQGGGHAAMLGKLYRVARVNLFASTEPASWTASGHLTPASEYFGFVHTLDNEYSVFVQSWNNLQLPGPITTVDGAAPPYGGSHQPQTSGPPRQPGKYHGAVVTDYATPLDVNGTPLYREVWIYMITGGTPQ